MTVRFVRGDVLRFVAHYRDAQFHAMLTDPPYELGFMGKHWDNSGVAFRADTWAALASLLHPGAFIMAFASSRGWHRQAVAMEDAGLVIHPAIWTWVYSSGFPKATRIDTQVDKAAGAEREIIGDWKSTGTARPNKGTKGHSAKKTTAADANYDPDDDVRISITAPATPLARAWEGHRYGLQALKPAVEPIIVAQKPYMGKPINIITTTGAGALDITSTRIAHSNNVNFNAIQRQKTQNPIRIGGAKPGDVLNTYKPEGLWPANFILSHLPECDKTCAPGCAVNALRDNSRFFFAAQYDQLDAADQVAYFSKSPRSERNAGLERGSNHPTHKPLALARYLAKMLLPPAEYNPRRLFVPFSGAGSEAIGAAQAGWDEIIGVEKESEYVDIARKRAAHWLPNTLI